jgi:hypothetical protein
MSSSSTWGAKLQSKLDALSNASSNESCQALAKWIGFNRKQLSAHFAPVLVRALQSNKQPVILNVLNETLLLERDNAAKWDKLGDVRLAVGEQVLLPSVSQLSQPSKDRVVGWLGTEWEEAGVFGERPTFAEQLRRALRSTLTTAAAESGDGEGADSAHTDAGTGAAMHTAIAAPASAPADDEGESAKASKDPASEDAGPKASSSSSSPKRGASKNSQRSASSPPPPQATTTAAAAASSSSTGDGPASSAATAAATAAAPFDFESRGIPPADVDPDDLLRHSRQIATFQIGRDLRNDNAVQLSSLLASLPSEVRTLLLLPKEGEEDDELANAKTIALDESTARDLSGKVNPALLDMDLDEQLQDVLHFRELVLKQQIERRKLIELLIASRCNFGARDAASAFSKADRSMAELVERRQVLLDAMELEGLDVATEEETAASNSVTLDELPPLTWYRPEDSENIKGEDAEEHDSKRQKVRCVHKLIDRAGVSVRVVREVHPSDESQCFNTIHACQLSHCGLDLNDWKASEGSEILSYVSLVWACASSSLDYTLLMRCLFCFLPANDPHERQGGYAFSLPNIECCTGTFDRPSIPRDFVPQSRARDENPSIHHRPVRKLYFAFSGFAERRSRDAPTCRDTDAPPTEAICEQKSCDRCCADAPS